MIGIDLNALLMSAKSAAIAAGVEIIKIYETGDFSVEAKSDNSPLTKADRAAHNIIVAQLEGSGLPVLSEEGKAIDYNERKEWEYFWMIDPLDGTKEFIKKNGEFTVNIALIKNGKVVLGVVYAPVLQDIYYAVEDDGAFKNGEAINVREFNMSDSALNVVASRSHLTSETQEFLDVLNEPKIVSKGSSLKLLMVAEGSADLYPRYAPTMEWDTAAAQIIVEEAGGSVLVADSKNPVHYNKPDLLNPYFLVCGNIK